VATTGQPSDSSQLGCGETELVQPRSLGEDSRRLVELLVRRASPQVQRVVQEGACCLDIWTGRLGRIRTGHDLAREAAEQMPGTGDSCLEPVGVDGVDSYVQRVTGWTRHHDCRGGASGAKARVRDVGRRRTPAASR